MEKLVTILVPTDFSAAAKAAGRFAASLAVPVKAKVVLLSVVEMDTSETVLHSWKVLENQNKASALRNLEKQVKEIQASFKTPPQISTDLVVGMPKEEMIVQRAKEISADLIVMGTKGASGLKKIFSGSNTARIIQLSHIPVVAIPAKITFSQLAKIVYASDLKNVHAETKTLAKIASLFNAHIMVLHVVGKKEPARIDRNLEPALIEKCRYGAISFHQVEGDAVDTAIADFIQEQRADMLVMYTHKLDFVDRAMGKSVTRSLAFRNQVPLLVFKKTSPQG